MWNRSVPRRAAAGTVLRRAGEPAGHLPLLLDGTVAATRTTGAGRVVRFGQWRGPCALDKTAVFDGGGHSATLTALSPCSVRYVPRGDVLSLTDDVRAVRRHVLRTLAAQVRAGQTEFTSLATLPSEARLALWLLEAAPDDGDGDGNGEVPLPTHQALAELLGVTRVTVSRALGRLRTQGLIATERRRVTLLAPELLALRASGGSPGAAPSPL
ncbi:Crp/Fnr family transcriptional regulator [Streptomyces sp. NPDC048172]|uniref:Crp/Fnr family transcriptional regulator n=1 Tax=Streptomyces sp. NPDC048172 TaxID=3365505 RepID=UPI003715C090